MSSTDDMHQRLFEQEQRDRAAPESPIRAQKLTCSGCPSLITESWSEVVDGERDCGTKASCAAKEGKTIHSVYWQVAMPRPDWCPILQADPILSNSTELAGDLIRFDFINADGQLDSKMLTHDEMRQRYSELLRRAAPASAASDPVPQGWEVTHAEPWSGLTPEAQQQRRISVKRLSPPFCGKDGIRQWSGPTLSAAFDSACAALNLPPVAPASAAAPAAITEVVLRWTLKQIADLDPRTGSIGTAVLMAKEALAQTAAHQPPAHEELAPQDVGEALATQWTEDDFPDQPAQDGAAAPAVINEEFIVELSRREGGADITHDERMLTFSIAGLMQFAFALLDGAASQAEPVAQAQQPTDEDLGELYTAFTGSHIWDDSTHARVVNFARVAHFLLSHPAKQAQGDENA